MLDPADARIVERDPRLPGLPILLDAEAFAGVLRRLCPDRQVLWARARYLRYKPQTSCLVSFEVGLPSGMTRVYARCHRDDLSFKVDNARLQMEVPGPLGPGLMSDPESAIAIFAYPNDYEIRSMRKLFEADRAPTRIRRIIPGHPHLHRLEPEFLRYKPERRFVCRLSGEGGPGVAIRLYPEAQFADSREKAWAFHDKGLLHVPRVVGDSVRYSALAQEWVAGERMLQILQSPGRAVEALDLLGGALVALHRQRPRLRELYSPDDYCRMAGAACAAVGAADPELGRRAAAVHQQVGPWILGHRWRTQAVHGDFTADQIVVKDGRVTILDFDRVGYGDPCMDVGAFVAGLTAQALAGRLTLSQGEDYASAFTGAYWRAAGMPEPATFRWFVAAALLLMAPEPFRFRLEGWQSRASAVVDAAERMLTHAAVGA